MTSTQRTMGTDPRHDVRSEDLPACGHAEGPGDLVGADPVPEAFRTWMRVCARSGWVACRESETVGLAGAVGRVTIESTRALWSSPAYRAVAMDGIAVRALDTTGAADREPVRLPAGRFHRVDTGDPMPEHLDAVVMREYVEFDDDGAALVATAVSPDRHVRSVGEDIEAGQVVLAAGHRIRPVDAAALAAAGHTTIRVRSRPVVAILPTGDEVRPLGAVPAHGEVLDTNSLMLAGMVEEAGGSALCLPIAPDQPDTITGSLTAAAERADLVLVIAGSSAGRDDHTPAVIGALGEIAVRGVAMRPGHPVLLGLLTGGRPVPVVGVPGYPASAERTFTCFALPLLRRLLGADHSADDGVPARLGSAISSPSHLDEQVRLRLARVSHPRTGFESLVAIPLRRGAGAMDSMVRTEATLRIPIGRSGFAAGADVRPIPVPGAAFRTGTILVNGLISQATAELVALTGEHRETVHWTESDPLDAAAALLDGLCHAAAVRLEARVDVRDYDAVAAIVTYAGEVTVLEIARTASAREVLVVPGAAFDSPPITALRTVLRSEAFRRGLVRCHGYSGWGAGHETWQGPVPLIDDGSDVRLLE